MHLEIKVIGTPGPQGSKSFKGMAGNHAILVESSKKVKPWREAVVYAAREAMAGRPAPLLRGPVLMTVAFTVRKAKSAPKKRTTYADRTPDLSKLVRSTEDALTTAGVWEDDARVVWCKASKVFPGEGEHSLDVLGAWISIEELVPRG